MNNLTEIIWASGLFEGEGCFTLSSSTDTKYGRKYLYPKASLCMTDHDVVERFANAIGFGPVRAMALQVNRDDPTRNYRQRWEWYVQGHEAVQAVIALLWAGLGERRRARAKEILDFAVAQQTRSYRRSKSLIRRRNCDYSASSIGSSSTSN